MNRLPSVVLASCATLISDTDPRPIIPLTHVCRYWRGSITSNPRSWASIATGWKRLVPLCLERTGVVSLAVDITISDIRSDKGFLESLLPQISRIGRLRLTGYSFIEAATDNLPGFFDSPMPDLTSLDLQQTIEPTELFPSDKVPTPPVFRNVRKLESLRLIRTPLYPALFSVASLGELKLLGYTSPFHFGTFLGFLESNPDLKRVVLDIQFIADSVEMASASKISLPRLQHLSTTCSKPIDSKGLLSSISLPRGVHLEVVSTHPDPSAKLGSFLPSPLTPILELLTPITTIKTQLTPQGFRLSGNGSTFAFRSTQDTNDAHAELRLFPGANVRELYTNIHPFGYSDRTLFWMLEQLPALETLAFSNTMCPGGLPSALTKEPILCPALKTVAFLDSSITSDTIKTLGEAIEKRKDSIAARLYRVVIVDSTGRPPDLASIQQLRRCVPCVEVRTDDKLPDLS